jgi:hypothetical protein
MKPLFQFFSSLKLTVVLLSFSLILIFFGTLDQVQYGIWHTQELYFESFLVVWTFPEHAPLGQHLHWIRIPMPGGYLLGGMLLINLLAAHFTRFKMSWMKCGIFLIHSGLILLLISELMTDILAVESQMPVDEGGTSNYSQGFRENELVFIDRSHPEHDSVHTIPASLLKPGKRIDVPNTPLSIRTVRYHGNAEIGRATSGSPAESIATRGAAVRMGIIVNPKPETYSEDEINTATAFVEVLKGEDSLGIWLVCNVMDERFPPQMVDTGDRSFEIALRFTRHYYPFEIELIDFKHEKYPGTEVPFNFSSEVKVTHQDGTKNQKALIYMNHPLRYEGLTFFQASFANQDKTSIFQVVRNPGWLLPYLSVLLMGLGMCVQFGMHFFKFLRKQARMKKIIYILVYGIATLVILGGLRSSKVDSDFDLAAFAELPVQVGGRIKPLDSVARNTLLILSGRQKVVTDEGLTLSPIEWFIDLTMRPEVADTYPIFKIEFPDDLGLVGLAEQGERYYSFNELLPFSEELRRLHGEINPAPELRSPYEKQIADINNGLMRYHRVMHSLHPVGGAERLDRLVDEYQSYLATIQPGMIELRKQQAGEEFDAALLKRFITFADDYLKLSTTAYLRVVPPPPPVDLLEDWKNIGLGASST